MWIRQYHDQRVQSIGSSKMVGKMNPTKVNAASNQAESINLYFEYVYHSNYSVGFATWESRPCLRWSWGALRCTAHKMQPVFNVSSLFIFLNKVRCSKVLRSPVFFRIFQMFDFFSCEKIALLINFIKNQN